MALFALAVWAVLLAESFLAARDPDLVERAYSRSAYPLVARGLTAVSRLAPFAIAEVLLLAIVAALPWLAYCAVRALRARGRLRRLGRFGIATVLVAGLVGLAFELVWGINYDRRPVAALLGLDASPSLPSELASLASDLVAEAADLRRGLPEDPGGAMRLGGGLTDALARAPKAWDPAPEGLGAARLWVRPKAALLSPLMAYAGITGIYVPFTGEALVNGTMPDAELPFTACHELAHQRGFAREDEANYLAYVACRRHPDRDFQYAGTFAAARYALSALRRADAREYERVRESVPPPVERDISALVAWKQRYRSRLENVQSRVNDAYLRAQGQPEGVQSYGRMVDLLLAERRAAARRKVSGAGVPD
jgi:uncharacterized protein DUF3810